MLYFEIRKFSPDFAGSVIPQLIWKAVKHLWLLQVSLRMIRLFWIKQKKIL